MFSRGNDAKFDDYLSAFSEAFVDACSTHDQRIGSFCTHLYYQLLGAAKSQSVFDQRCPKIDGVDKVGRNHKPYSLAELSDDAHWILKLLRDTPAELASIATGYDPWIARGKLQNYLLDRGWPIRRIQDCLYELHQYVKGE